MEVGIIDAGRLWQAMARTDADVAALYEIAGFSAIDLGGLATDGLMQQSPPPSRRRRPHPTLRNAVDGLAHKAQEADTFSIDLANHTVSSP